MAGTRIPFGGHRWIEVDTELASRFHRGDRLIVIQDDGTLVHVPASVSISVDEAVSRAERAFRELGRISQDAVTEFFETFARMLEDESSFEPIARANDVDVTRAKEAGKAVGRLTLGPRMRQDMISSLRIWRDMQGSHDVVVERVEHDEWTVESVVAPLGIVGFVFEGRPNVFADATGVLRGGNVAVMRIGSDALGTARAIMEHALQPALRAAGLPAGCIELVAEQDRSAGHALFSDRRLALAVARGSGPAVAQLGAVARQSGVAVSLHGTGGAWMLIDGGVPPERVRGCVEASLDRKVCNTLNVVVLIGKVDEIDHAVLQGASDASRRTSSVARVHVVDRAITTTVDDRVRLFDEKDVEILAREWEWDSDPEFSVVRVEHLEEAIELFNRHSPHFIVSALLGDASDRERAYAECDAPFYGDGFTRWVDGQYALRRPELGLSNWEFGRLFARGSILSGDGVNTIRFRAHTPNSGQRR